MWKFREFVNMWENTEVHQVYVLASLLVSHSLLGNQDIIIILTTTLAGDLNVTLNDGSILPQTALKTELQEDD